MNVFRAPTIELPKWIRLRRIVREELARTPPHGWLHKDAEDEIKRLRAERDALGWARVELANIVHAERFNKSHFADDTEFADWAQSRARHQLAAIDAAMESQP